MAGKASFTRWVKSVGSKAAATLTPPSDPEAWQPPPQPYPRLIGFDPVAWGLNAQTGIYAVWHLGVRPQWLKVGASHDLASTLNAAAKTSHITYFQPNGGVYVAWARIAPDRASGVALHVATMLRPVFQSEIWQADLPAAGQPIAFPLPPGVQT